MVACAKMFGGSIESCTRGEICICKKEGGMTALEILNEVDALLNTAGYGNQSSTRHQLSIAVSLIKEEQKKAGRFRDLLRQIGYPKRGTEEESMDIFDAAKLIQSNFRLQDLQD